MSLWLWEEGYWTKTWIESWQWKEKDEGTEDAHAHKVLRSGRNRRRGGEALQDTSWPAICLIEEVRIRDPRHVSPGYHASVTAKAVSHLHTMYK